ncbi:acetyl esterase/lipase [Chitinophaga skermanii]|uniref:Acetyl esterase/lipase n=1 Tax=Chitinophaga skermanii TaxID=331697 RepID=A0A327QTD1_9BACT|nr:alpha/beta hydrolase [Chitinophaga skermanii]RAJ05017.1 acetyl esterase/lipase [Chitinophaga skermanii]
MPLSRILIIFLSFAFYFPATAQQKDSVQQVFHEEWQVALHHFAAHLDSNYASIYTLPEKSFVSKIDAAKKVFATLASKYKTQIDPRDMAEQQLATKYYFDKLLLDYPVQHDIYTEKTQVYTPYFQGVVTSHLKDFNQPQLLQQSYFTDYGKSFFTYAIQQELKKPIYKNLDNQQLLAAWHVIAQYVSNQVCKDYWQAEFLYQHIDYNGIKNIQTVYNNFKATCKDTAVLHKVVNAYEEDAAGRKGHLIKTYKTVGAYNLDMHIFLPSGETVVNKRRPVIVFFHGGNWSVGKPDWFFETCEAYAQKGWVACAVEYRTFRRHGTLPFEAVMDAKTAIRWIREQANDYNIDANRVVASGNSAGGHLVLCTALVDLWNEKTDNWTYNPVPNVLLVNAGIYDLTGPNTAWMRKDLRNKNSVKEISPNYLVNAGLPPTLLIHGTADSTAPFVAAKYFFDHTKQAGNANLEFVPLEGAGHFITSDPKYAGEVEKLRAVYLSRFGL